MKVVKSVSELKDLISEAKGRKKNIGLVPTMGALHAGHISLVTRCVSENEFCVVSVFVNPTQFNDKSDLAAYPRTPEQDAAMLEKAGCDIVFMPEVEEMYPEPDTRQFSFGALEQVMEGPYRPGHFNGVAQIVSKLFFAAEPDKAYFGEKDFQQVAIIREMVKQLALPIQIVSCPIVREADGLAMSSRNQRLNTEERKKSVLISKVLFESRTFADEKTVAETKAFVEENTRKVDIFRLDYFEIVDGYTLQPVSDWNQTSYVVGCIAVYCGPVRLIDNIIYKS